MDDIPSSESVFVITGYYTENTRLNVMVQDVFIGNIYNCDWCRYFEIDGHFHSSMDNIGINWNTDGANDFESLFRLSNITSGHSISLSSMIALFTDTNVNLTNWKIRDVVVVELGFYFYGYKQVYLFNVEIENIHLVHQPSWSTSFFYFDSAPSDEVLDFEFNNIFVNGNYSYKTSDTDYDFEYESIYSMDAFMYFYLPNSHFNLSTQESKAYIDTITIKNMHIAEAVIRFDTSKSVKTQLPITFDNLQIESIYHGSATYFGDQIPSAIIVDESYILANDNNALTIEFNNCEIANNVNFGIVSCLAGSYCNITFSNSIFYNNTLDYNGTILYNVFTVAEGTFGEINIVDSVFVGNYDNQEESINSSFINYDIVVMDNDTIAEQSAIHCVNCIFYNTLPPTIAPTNIPTIAPSNIPSLKPTNLPTNLPTNVPAHLPTTGTTSIHNDSFPFVVASDISFVLFEAQSVNGDNTTFNPGFRKVFESKIEIELTSEFMVNTFENGDILS